ILKNFYNKKIRLKFCCETDSFFIFQKVLSVFQDLLRTDGLLVMTFAVKKQYCNHRINDDYSHDDIDNF
ncbi:hypothetical protein ACFFH5_02665, partial [Epilithonimonas hispanica]